MKNFILITSFLFLFSSLVLAQNEEDVLRYSTYDVMGTARYIGLGGAYGAVGADFSSLSTNPAGIGVYKRSEFTISPSIFFGNTEGTYNGRTLDDGKNNFALGNVGIVITGKPVDRLDKNPLVNYQFGFGLTRLKDFNIRYVMEGENNQSSLLDTYLEYAGSKNPNSLNAFDTRPAFDTFLIDTIPGETDYTYIDAYDYIGGFTSAIQRKSVETSGSINEVVLSGGMNVSNRIYFGLTFGFPYMRYQQKSLYKEFNQTEERDLEEFSVYENLETKGSGFNIKLGTIVKVNQFLRLGAAFHTPTWYNNITDKWNSTTEAYYANGDYFNAQSPFGEYTYDIKTPWHFLGSAAVVVGKIGLFSADYEYVDYSTAKLSPSVDFTNENDVIKTNFTQTHNFRFGAEVFIGAVQLRGGYAYKMSPFVDGVNDGSIQIISGGIGYRTAEFFVDAALSYYGTGMDYYLYSSDSYSAKADLSSNNYNLIFTLGYRFD
ncbi:MAG: outer membrane protein transport protein [Bacteroidales bacterium]|nr:outer membrane protein transport protein [Bacteroidales bacterium]